VSAPSGKMSDWYGTEAGRGGQYSTSSSSRGPFWSLRTSTFDEPVVGTDLSVCVVVGFACVSICLTISFTPPAWDAALAFAFVVLLPRMVRVRLSVEAARQRFHPAIGTSSPSISYLQAWPEAVPSPS
jgi:hypothetical protein